MVDDDVDAATAMAPQIAPTAVSTEFWNTFMKRLCQVTRVFLRDESSFRTHLQRARGPLQPAKGCARERVKTRPRRQALSPSRNMAARGLTLLFALCMAHNVPAHDKIRRRSRAVYGTALRNGQVFQRADSSSLTTSNHESLTTSLVATLTIGGASFPRVGRIRATS